MPSHDPDMGVPGSQNLAPLARLAPVMNREARSRPAVRVTADHVFAALTSAGVEIRNQKQVLATTANAAYCALGVTGDSIAVAVCEYPSPAVAKAGLAMLDSRYRKLVPDAVRRINGTTLITVANASSHKDVRDKVLGVFMSL